MATFPIVFFSSPNQLAMQCIHKKRCRRFLLISNLPTQGRTVLVVQRLAVGRQLRLLSPSWTGCLKTPMESLPSSSPQQGMWASLISHVQQGHMFTYLVFFQGAGLPDCRSVSGVWKTHWTEGYCHCGRHW